MKTVSLQALPDYDPATVAAALDTLLSPLGGIKAFIRPGQKVLIKPNMLAGKAPEKAVTTHPSIVREVILRVQSAGAVAVVGDSPGIGSCRQVAQKCGILQVIEETGAKLATFTESVPIGGSGESGHRLEVAREVIAADSIINLPKVDPRLCCSCGLCVKHCPPQAMTLDSKRVRIDLNNCISCFCCQELCPEGAIETQQGFLLRLADFIHGRT
ncbi:DUF362 domain-containing protein [Geoalkalibacter subterraneus]|uniref:4Fe-4S ferredoxin-type domain-containing protein n=1 Tax=Geoalkalibacter subterraneus TaxID=483547 RepID=A0A0B5FMK9_9BACT|nr:DUF362 domain-containing protein [Geoalkalibacter subterraneus]AJF05889.1 hypothetical protein GSUB_03980 [Geoalkalibacter subterraneus]